MTLCTHPINSGRWHLVADEDQSNQAIAAAATAVTQLKQGAVSNGTLKLFASQLASVLKRFVGALKFECCSR
jgi:hypothetical protein